VRTLVWLGLVGCTAPARPNAVASLPEATRCTTVRLGHGDHSVIGYVTKGGRPVQELGVAVFVESTMRPMSHAMPIANAQGCFEIRGITGIDYANLVIASPGSARGVARHIAVSTDADVGTIAVDDGYTVEGRVVSTDGSPVAGAEVEMNADAVDGGQPLDALAAEHLRTWTDASGAYHLHHVAPVEMFDAYRTMQAKVEGRLVSEPAPVPDRGGVVNLVARPIGVIEGTVSFPGKIVAAYSTGPTATFAIGSVHDGHFRLPRVAVGTYVISVDRKLAHAQTVVVSEGAVTVINF